MKSLRKSCSGALRAPKERVSIEKFTAVTDRRYSKTDFCRDFVMGWN